MSCAATPFNPTASTTRGCVGDRQNAEQADNTYLGRCYKQISSSSSDAAKMDRYATVYKVGAYALVAIFSAAAIAAFVTTGLLASTYLPAAMISIMCSMHTIGRWQTSLLHSSAQNKECAERTRAIDQEYQTLKEKNEDTVLAAIKEVAPRVQEGAISRDSAKFKAIFAHYNYWSSLSTKLQKIVEEHVEYGRTARSKIEERYQDEIRKKELTEERLAELTHEFRIGSYHKALEFRQQALRAKVEAAFIGAVMNNPSFQRNASDICDLKNFASVLNEDWILRSLFLTFQDAQGDDFLIFKDQKEKPISLHDVELDSLTKLTDRISGVISRSIG